MRLPFNNFSSVSKESCRKVKTNAECDYEPDYEKKEISSDFDSQSSAKSNEDNNDENLGDDVDGEITFDDDDDDFLDGLVENSSKSRELCSTSKIIEKKDSPKSQPTATSHKEPDLESGKRSFCTSTQKEDKTSDVPTVKKEATIAYNEIRHNTESSSQQVTPKDVQHDKSLKCRENIVAKSKCCVNYKDNILHHLA